MILYTQQIIIIHFISVHLFSQLLFELRIGILEDCLQGSRVKVEVVQGQETFVKEYPCLAAVNRCASHVARHDGRVIWLTYEPADGKFDRTSAV